MKGIFYSFAIIGLLVFGASCSKKYNCQCYSYSSSATSTTTVRGVNKDAAAINCTAKSNTSQVCALQ